MLIFLYVNICCFSIYEYVLLFTCYRTQHL